MNTGSPFLVGLLTGLALGTSSLNAQSTPTPLKVGDTVPDVTLRTEDNRTVGLRPLILRRPTVLIFYRGGWCPFCNRQLQALAGIEADLRAAGAQLLAISPDRPAKLKETLQRGKLGYQLLSDADAEAIRAFGLAFQVDDALVKKYLEEYRIDLEAASGHKHHLLPHPAVYVVDSRGIVRFAHVNPDYKARLEPTKILEAVREVLQ